MPDDDKALQQEIRELVSSRYWKLVRTFLLNPPCSTLPWSSPRPINSSGRTVVRWRRSTSFSMRPSRALFEFAKNKIAGEPLPEELKPLWLPPVRRSDGLSTSTCTLDLPCSSAERVHVLMDSRSIVERVTCDSASVCGTRVVAWEDCGRACHG